MKKSQLLSQPFFFIFALVVVALILIWAFTSIIPNIFKTSEQIEISTFLADLRDEVKTYYYLDEGSSTQLNLKLHPKVKYVCIVNITAPINVNNLDGIDEGLSFRAEHTTKNILLIPATLKIFNYNIEHLNVNTEINNPLCIQTKGSLRAVIENRGANVEIRKITP